MSLMPFTGTRSLLSDPMWDWTVSDPFREDFFRVADRPLAGFRDTNKAISPLLTSDLIEKANEYEVHADLPGVNPEDMEVTISENCLCMKAERKHVHERTTDTVHTMERSFGRVNRRIALPRDADFTKISTKFKNGVLTVTVPKLSTGEPTSRKIPIQYE
mmetsp:Transcript_2892/g.4438  ORF Transcript_2892/g.4438 Transcript_2892/m.4438 type:complete len:160 (-) Transcript_2892:252-731(-)|eukprot:CAMPEP_0174968666 /NCGR_PEP_ID=MMETSP0004_2-20121128/8269_1 /TAXON_ID=420556 /ORGANISM="Ochromonas sp., Strain CCMP1393" /LENGTH=159 /DNA_ID=CAMNT_0016217941 /DNA_START=45 /DNA_END=524 /DNA_ORIENTATION=-